MKDFNPELIDLEELFGRSIEQLEEERNKALPFLTDWGNPRVVSLRDRDTPVKVQWGGTCSAFALIAAMENKLGGQYDLSERSLWNAYRVFNIDKAISAAKRIFIHEENSRLGAQEFDKDEYVGEGRFKLTDAKCIDRRYDLVIEAIDRGIPCFVALVTPVDLIRKLSQIERTSKLENGGHAMAVSGYKVENGKGYFLVKNSWGENCGDKGYQYIDFNIYDENKKGYIYFYTVGDIIDRNNQKAI